MTAETAVKIEGENCVVEMKSTCEDLPPKSVGGGGDSKDDYVFVNGSDSTSDDNGEVEGNAVSESNADLQGTIGGGGGDGDRLGVCNGLSDKVDHNVVVVNGGVSKLENGIVVEKESDGCELVKENGEIKVENEAVIEDREVVLESGDKNNNEGDIDVKDRDLEVVEEINVESKGDEVKDGELVKGDDCNASADGIGCPSLDNDDNIDVSDKLPNGSPAVELESQLPCGEIEEQVQLDENENYTEESEVMEDEVRKPEVIEVSMNPHIDESEVIEVNSNPHIDEVEFEPKDDVVEELKPIEADVVHQSQKDDHIDIQPLDGEDKSLDSGGGEVSLPDDAITEKQSAEGQQQVLQPADNGELDPVETEAEVIEQGDLDPPGMIGSKDLEPLDNDATICDLQQSVKNQDASDLTLESEGSQEPSYVPELSEGAVNESNLALTASELDGSALESTGECDETTTELVQEVTGTSVSSTAVAQSDEFDKPADDHELDTVYGEEKVEVNAQVERNVECLVQEASPLDQVVEDTGLVHVVEKEVPSEEVNAQLEGRLECSAQEASPSDQVVEDTGLVHVVENEVPSEEVNAQVELSLECSVQEASPLDQVVEDIGLVHVIEKEVSSEDVSLNKATTVEETANPLIPKSADEVVVAEKSNDLEVSDQEDVMPGNNATVPESSHDSGSNLISEGGGDLIASLDSRVALPVPRDIDMIKEQGVMNDGSYVGESSSEANSKNSNDALPCSVNGTEIEVKPASDDFHDLSKKSFGSEGTLTFGAFVCQTNTNGVSTSLADVTTQIITEGVSASSPEESGVSTTTSLSDANAQIVTDGVSASSPEGSGVSTTTSLSDANAQIVTDGVSASPPKESWADSVDGETVNPVKSPFRWLIKVPRLDDVEYEQIKKVQMELEKKTQDRDAFRKVFQERLAIFQEVKDKFHAAKTEERSAHQLVMAKKREIDSAQSLLKLARDGNTVERIDGQILLMERRIQHETMDLTEEKKLVREIKQLNHQRERLAADTQGQQEVYQAVGRRVETEEQLKVLRKEMDALRENHGKAFERFKAAEKKFEDESILRRKLEAEKVSLAKIRQEAYEHLQTLKKQAYEKNKPCYNYRDASKAILNLKAGEEESLERLCVNQVENFMELWNKNDKFRKEYIRCNKRSILRRFGTLDGRDLGIDEKKPLLENSSVNGKTSAKVNTVVTASIFEREFPLVVKKVKEEDSSEKVIEQKNTNAPAKKKAETTSNNSVAEPSGRIETQEKEEAAKRKEEEELAKKAEQKRREEEAERLKEHRRSEEKAKAQEALERKKKMAEKAQSRAKFKAEKEAEEKKKEMEKRAKKKGKKKGLTVEPAEIEPAEVPESSSETIKEPEVTEKPVTVPKKSHKPAALYTKQVKTTKSIPAPPAPLRNRGKRRIPQWAWWLLLAILTALVIFPLGNIDIVGLLKPFVSGSYK